MEPRWCPRCDTKHGRGTRCPGALLATGEERAGWRVTVETPTRVEAIGVLVAPCGPLWRARILTYPNVLWTVPGGVRAMKFAGPSPREAEARAIAFIERHLADRGWLRRDALGVVPSPRVPPEAALAYSASGTPARRKLRAFPVRFGAAASNLDGVTANVSETGLFVATLEPLDPGAALVIRLEIEDEQRFLLRGCVVWKRAELRAGRPCGMGVRLIDPPEAYVRAVQALA